MQIAPTIVIDASLTAMEGFENRLSIVRPGGHGAPRGDAPVDQGKTSN
jgi:hypothetical protein